MTDPLSLSAFPDGDYLVSVHNNRRSIQPVTPALAPLIAASKVASYVMADALCDESMFKPAGTLTPKQNNAWKIFNEELGDDCCQLTRPAAYEIAEAGINALIAEAEKRMTVPAVKLAYDHFLLVYELTKNDNTTG